MSEQKIKLAQSTHTGCVREHNEDSSGHILPEGLGDPAMSPIDAMAVVADGMGGMAAGEVASDITVKAVVGKMQEWIDAWASRASKTDTALCKAEGNNDDLPSVPLVQSVIEANRQVIAEGEKDPGKRGMGTTCTAAALSGSRLYLAHVGDSRAYLIRKGHLMQLTDDHSLVQEMVDDGLISAEDAWDHPRKNIVTRSIGSDPNLEVATYIEDLFAGDLILLCSDGLNTMIRDSEIERIMTADIGIHDKCDDLIRSANEAGGNDNTTVMVLAVP
jgi:serine/threonine protein phosphatase PrpC